MLATLDVAHADARADMLAFTLDQPPLAALMTRSLRMGGVDVELRLLGRSHQVIAGPVVETVAVLDGRPGPLPYELGREVGGWNCRFVADVYRRDAVDFGRAAAFLRTYLAHRDDTVAAIFAGNKDAISAVTVRQIRRGLDWRSWHTYPRTREIVCTRTRMLIR